MSARNAWLSWINQIDGASLSASSAATPDGGVDNLKTRRLGQPWRSTNHVAYFRADFGSAVSLDLLSLFGLNIASSDLIRHRLSSVAPGDYELLDQEIESDIQAGYGQHLYPLAAPISARYWECRISATSLSAQGWFDLGRAWAGPVYQPERNFSYDASGGFVDLSRVTRGELSGIRDAEIGALLRQQSFALDFMSAADRRQIEDMQRTVRRSGQLLFMPQPDDADWRNRDAILGGLDRLDPIRNPKFRLHATAFTITEDP